MSTATAFKATGKPLAQEFEEIFREHSQLVYRTAYSVTGSPQDAEDILQGVFLWVLRRGIPSALKENPKAYLHRAAVNLSLNTVRSRRHHIRTADVERLQAPVVANEPRPGRDIQRGLVDAMAQLNPRAVEILTLRYAHAYSDAEIGKLLGTSRGVIAVTLHRARARLKKLLRASAGEKA